MPRHRIRITGHQRDEIDEGHLVLALLRLMHVLNDAEDIKAENSPGSKKEDAA